jgi:streptomycin 6-kinase
LTELARLAHEVAADWGLELGPRFPGARHSFVAPVGPDAVLKIQSAADDESDEEADALALWAGDGAPRLLRADRSRRALLLERAVPGTDLAGVPEADAIAIAVDVARRLWRPAGKPFRWIGDHVPRWLDAVDTSDPGAALLPRARRLLGGLDVGRATLVHGDFHHHNVLAAGQRHVAIDPKPMLGEPEYDVPPFLWNPMDRSMDLETTLRRLESLEAAGLDRGRMRAWAVIRGAYLAWDTAQVEVIRRLDARWI